MRCEYEFVALAEDVGCLKGRISQRDSNARPPWGLRVVACDCASVCVVMVRAWEKVGVMYLLCCVPDPPLACDNSLSPSSPTVTQRCTTMASPLPSPATATDPHPMSPPASPVVAPTVYKGKVLRSWAQLPPELIQCVLSRLRHSRH